MSGTGNEIMVIKEEPESSGVTPQPANKKRKRGKEGEGGKPVTQVKICQLQTHNQITKSSLDFLGHQRILYRNIWNMERGRWSLG